MKSFILRTLILMAIFGIGAHSAFANTTSKSPSTLSEANKIILLLQKQIELLQDQLAEQRAITKKAITPVYYASIVGSEKKCTVILLAEKDGTQAIGEEVQVTGTYKKSKYAHLRKARTETLTTDEEGKVRFCQPATKLVVKGSALKAPATLVTKATSDL